MSRRLLSILCLSLLLFSCSSSKPKATITQASTIDALLAGVYDGELTCGDLLKKGNFGLGTFDALDGEMLVLDGVVYQTKSDGKVYCPDHSLKTPFACVSHFEPDTQVELTTGLDFKSFEKLFDEKFPKKNLFNAIKITGEFKSVLTRAVQAQTKPYPSLAEATKTQPEFTMENIRGTLVGFRCPSYVKGINVPGYHLHFLSEDKTKGGHVLNFEVKEALCEVQTCHEFTILLPKGESDFDQVDLSADRSHELEQVERKRKSEMK